MPMEYKTRDDQPIVPGMKLWSFYWDGNHPTEVYPLEVGDVTLIYQDCYADRDIAVKSITQHSARVVEGCRRELAEAEQRHATWLEFVASLPKES